MRKLPDAYVLQKHIERGLDGREIAAIYGCHPDSVREVLRKAGLVIRKPKAPPVNGARPAYRPRQERNEVELLPDRIVFTREVTAGTYGGMMFQRISVPRISSHIAALQDAGRC
ncbi:hypothetical protein [Rhizobium sp. BK602]|uniref:hypothetical protein n=1 Tax=Rhizobium sp. BK602 TaxID=2586986 RepID=UPI0016124473|nr:hypothetical protein [Rhizobium sp. BK602]MBB3608622.1 hypothetical protein [Rhizobium sp. BK602]